jgi:hypothetical protein
MTIHLGNLTFDCSDPLAVSAFWAAALDRPVADGASPYFAQLAAQKPGEPNWLFIKVPEGKTVKNRCHPDLFAADRPAEIERLVGLGASVIAEHDEWGMQWTTLGDVEGNEFCVGQQR